MSYENYANCGLTELELASGVYSLIYGSCGRNCGCEICEDTDWDEVDEAKLRSSEKFKEAAKLIAGLADKKQIKLVLIQRAHSDHLESAIVRYMAKEELPGYYSAILKDPDCIIKLIEGIFYKVCRIVPEVTLTSQIRALSGSLRKNDKQRIAYDRVTEIQQFIHGVVDQRLGVGTARCIPVTPMKNALTAARLHLHILDVVNRRPEYIECIDKLTMEAMRREYESPRPPTAPFGKRRQPRWRVRHLRPLSYYFPKDVRSHLQSIRDMDESIPLEQFLFEAASLYALR